MSWKTFWKKICKTAKNVGIFAQNFWKKPKSIAPFCFIFKTTKL